MEGILLVAAVAAALVADGRAEERFAVECRGFGRVEVVRSGDRTEYRAEDAKRAQWIVAKRRNDLLAFGDFRDIGGNSLALDGTGTWTLTVDGKVVTETFSPKASYRDVTPDHHLPTTTYQLPSTPYPAWLDCFDNAGPSVWIGGGGRCHELPDDFEWLKAVGGLGFCSCHPGQDRLVALNTVDFSIFDWHEAMAKRYGLPHRQLLFPSSFEWIWNLRPLPYIHPTPGFVPQPSLHVLNQNVVGFEMPNPGTDRLRWDLRRRLAMRYGGDDSLLVGWHGCTEIPTATIGDLAMVAESPNIVRLWREKHAGKVPVPEDFLGDGPKLDLAGTWLMHPDRERAGAAALADGWTKGDSHDPLILLYANSAHGGHGQAFSFWMKRTFTVPKGTKDRYRYFHTAVAGYHGQRTGRPDVWVNGVKCESVASECAWSHCADVGAALREGENEILLDTHGYNLPGYAFLNATPLRPYPLMTEAENARYYEAIAFCAELRVKKIEGDLRAIRSVDPNRPLKLMATHSFYDLTLGLCRRYGAYQHDTGGAGAFWAPMEGGYYSRAHRLPYSCEQGGPPKDVAALRRSLTYYLNYGNDAVDLVFGVAHYAHAEDPAIRGWFEENAGLIRAIGKLRAPDPDIAVLRSTRMLRLGLNDPWNWDIGRGNIQSSGRTCSYIETCDLTDPAIRDRFKVIADDATLVMEDDEVAGIRAFVERGGTFVAQHHTGRHGPAKADSWPLLKAFGLDPSDTRDVIEKRVGKGRLIRLGTPRHARDYGYFAALFDELGLPKACRSGEAKFWGQRYESKNGAYDVYLASYLDEARENPPEGDFTPAFRRETPPAGLRDFGAKGHPAVASSWKDGFFTLPAAHYAAMQSRLYAAPAADPAGAGVRWIRAFAETWHPVEKVEWTEKPVPVDGDILVLDEDWDLGGRKVRPGTFAALGLGEDAVCTFTRRAALPADWRGRRVTLTFDAQYWFYGFQPWATLKINGRDADLRQPLVPQPNGAFTLDVTEQTKSGAIDLELTVDGTRWNIPSGRKQSMPGGVTGIFYLRREPEYRAQVPVTGPWFACREYGVREPVAPGEKKEHVYYETVLSVPAGHEGERMFLRSTQPLGALVINDRAVNLPRWMKEFDVTNLVRRDRPNLLRRAEDNLHPGSLLRPRTDPLPDLSLAFR